MKNTKDKRVQFLEAHCVSSKIPDVTHHEEGDAPQIRCFQCRTNLDLRAMDRNFVISGQISVLAYCGMLKCW